MWQCYLLAHLEVQVAQVAQVVPAVVPAVAVDLNLMKKRLVFCPVICFYLFWEESSEEYR